MKISAKLNLALFILATPLASHPAEDNPKLLGLRELCVKFEKATINTDKIAIKALDQELKSRGLSSGTCNPRNILDEMIKSGDLSPEQIKRLESAIKNYEDSRRETEESQKRHEIALEEEERLERECARIDCKNISSTSSGEKRKHEKLKSEIKKLQSEIEEIRRDGAKGAPQPNRSFDSYDLRRICKDGGLTGRCR